MSRRGVAPGGRCSFWTAATAARLEAAKDGEPRPINPETFITQGFGQHVLTASRSVERAYEGNQAIEGIETSLFTHFLIRGLETGEARARG